MIANEIFVVAGILLETLELLFCKNVMFCTILGALAVDLSTFTEEIPNGRRHFLFSWHGGHYSTSIPPPPRSHQKMKISTPLIE